MMVPGRVVGDLLVGAEVQEIKPYHYFTHTHTPHPAKQQNPQGSQVKKKQKSHTDLSSLLQSFQGGWAPSCKRVDSKGDLQWHCCQAHFLLKFYSSLTNVFLSQLRVILMQAATGKGSPILPSREFSPPLLCQHQHFCADETQPDKGKKNQPIN